MRLKYIGVKFPTINVRVDGTKRQTIKTGETFECSPDCASELLKKYNTPAIKRKDGEIIQKELIKFVEVVSNYSDKQEAITEEKRGRGRPAKVKMSDPDKTA